MANTHSVRERPPPSSPALPATPERGRSRTRYPSHLRRDVDAEGNPRPLLHRRGTSRTYETLEDLLKEAGYKETRVFTPEVERREAEREERTQRDAAPQADSGTGVGGAVAKLFSTWMAAGSRRTHPKRAAAADGDDGVRVPPSPLAHRSSNVPTLQVSSPPLSSSASTIRPRPHGASLLQQQHTLTRPSLSTTAASAAHPPSRARLALRHAASAPQIDKRRPGARTQPRTPRPSKPKVPPLPATWLESLSAALLSPRPLPASAPPASPAALPRKPAILKQQARTSVGTVAVTNVLCRSAPSSRSSSAVRPSRVLVPTLAQTTVEERGAPAWPPSSPQLLPDPAPAPADEDEDEELNLTMMLIPAKRQHSIRSLRSVLLQHDAFPASPTLTEEYARMMRQHVEESEAHAAHAADGDWDSGEFLTARVKRRRSGLPRNWGWSSS